MTGGAGFIGSHVVDRLIERGDDVVVVDDFNGYYSPSLKRSNVAHFSDGVEIYERSITDDLDDIFADGIDAVIHLAAHAGVRPSIENPKLYVDMNVVGTQNILDTMVRLKVKKLVFASSSSVYGNNQKVPFSEDDTVDYPISPYAATKKANELMCYTYHHLHGMDVNCLRFFTVYGPRGRPDMAIAKFTRLLSDGEPIEMYGDGTSQRDYTYISDIVDGVIGALDKDFGYEIFNLGNSETVELKRLVSVIENALGKKAQVVHKEMQQGDVDITHADISKSRKMLGFNPTVSIEEGVKRYVQWLKGLSEE